MNTPKEYSRYMSDFRGIDATSEASNVALNRFSFIQNMYKDYKSGQGVAIETFPGTRTLFSDLGGKVHGIHPYKVSSDKTHIVVHAGKKLYYFDSDKRDEIDTTSLSVFSDISMNEAKSSSFIYNSRLYLIDGAHYIVVYKNGYELKAEEIGNDNAYIPTTFAPVETEEADGNTQDTSEYEQRNMLTNKFKERTYLGVLKYNNQLSASSSGDARHYEYKEDGSPLGEGDEGVDMAVVCPSIWHVKTSSGYCHCNKSYSNDAQKNNFRESTIQIPPRYKHVKIDFDKVLLEWSKCKNASRYYYTSYNYYGSIYSNYNSNSTHDSDADELIGISELSNRYNGTAEGFKDPPINTSVRIPKYNYNNINTKALGSTEEAEKERRKYITSVVMENTVEYIHGSLDDCINLTNIILSDNIEKLDEKFFAGTAITTAYLPANLKELGANAFADCAKLGTIYASSKKIIEVTSATTMTSMYELLTEDLKTATNDNASEKYGIKIGTTIKSYESEFMDGIPHSAANAAKVTNRVYIKTPCEKVTSVKVKEAEISELVSATEGSTLYTPVYKYINGIKHVIAVDFYHTLCDEFVKDAEGNDTSESGHTEINGIVEIQGEAHESVFTTSEDAADESKDVLSSHKEYGKSAIEAIKGCTVCCTYDDRIFFTGNPELPNTVFYTQRDLTGHVNPTYVGVLNWFDDGAGNTPNVAMMANSTTLMVLKGNTMQDGSIFYHVGADGGNDLTPRIYPSTEGLAGLGCVGMAVNFRDDCVFMSNQGLEAVAKQTVNLERTIEHRSTNIDGLLLQADLTKAKAAEWEGYLCILIDGKMYLADSRQMYQGIGGAIEYEWYYVEPIGGYDGDNLKYYLADYMPEEIQQRKDEGLDIDISDAEDRSVDYSKVHGGDRCTDDDCDAYVYKDGEGKNIPIYFVKSDDGKTYLVDNDGEKEGGDLDNACAICAVEDVLYFGTEGGKTLCLNNDKRGEDRYTDEENKKDNEPDKSRIPVKYYNNSGHAYDAVAVLAMENAGVPHFTKSTVKRGTVLRLKSFPRSAFEIYATTDRTATTLLSKQSNSITTFDELDFANLGLLTTDSGILAIKEKTKKWVEKQYMLIGREYNKPWGLYSLAYRYIIAGGVKNQ